MTTAVAFTCSPTERCTPNTILESPRLTIPFVQTHPLIWLSLFRSRYLSAKWLRPLEMIKETIFFIHDTILRIRFITGSSFPSPKILAHPNQSTLNDPSFATNP